jgi:hypothetical protein
MQRLDVLVSFDINIFSLLKNLSTRDEHLCMYCVWRKESLTARAKGHGLNSCGKVAKKFHMTATVVSTSPFIFVGSFLFRNLFIFGSYLAYIGF